MKRIIAVMAMGALLSISAAAQAKGEDTYKSKCQMCHGADFKGQTAMGKKFDIKDFHAPDVLKKPDAEWIKTTSEGVKKDDKPVMPAFKGKLTDEQIKDVVAYIKGACKK